MRRGPVALALLTALALGPVTQAVAAEGGDFTLRDARITESSGLVDLGSVMVTTNDSGSAAKLYVVNPATGRTVGVTDFHADTVDVEALAPAGRKAVWVGDIGDNRRARRSISVYRVPVARGRADVHPPRLRLAFPDGAHDAEALFADSTGRLHVITKSFAGGTVYRAPARLNRNRVSRLRPVGKVGEFVTDAAMLPGRRHLLVRGLGIAAVYTFPQLRRLGSFRLPRQRQGEGVSVGPGGRIRLSSEGVRSQVLQIALPADIAQQLRAVAPGPSPSPSAAPSPSSTPSTSPSPSPVAAATPEAAPRAAPGRPAGRYDASRAWLLWGIPGVLVLGALGIGLGLRRRSE